MFDPHSSHLIRRLKLRGLISTSIELLEESFGLRRIVVLFEPVHYVGLQWENEPTTADEYMWNATHLLLP